jgi:hypothetical protein
MPVPASPRPTDGRVTPRCWWRGASVRAASIQQVQEVLLCDAIVPARQASVREQTRLYVAPHGPLVDAKCDRCIARAQQRLDRRRHSSPSRPRATRPRLT